MTLAKSKKILIFGTGRGADTARRYIESDTPHEIVGYVVDPEYLSGSTFHDRPVVTIPKSVDIFPPAEIHAFVPMGAGRMNGQRREKYALLKSFGYRFFSYIHSSNRIEGRCGVGENCLILEHQSLNFDSNIGNNVIMWSGCQLGDRSNIGNDAYLGAHVVINGDVEIGDGCYLGSNCTISHGIKVASNTFVGANALISEHTAPNSVHVVPSTKALGINSLRFMKLIRAPL